MKNLRSKSLLKDFIWFEQTISVQADPLEERLDYIKMAIERVFMKNDGLEPNGDLDKVNEKEYSFSFAYHDDLIIEFIFHFKIQSLNFFVSSYPKTNNEKLYTKMTGVGFYDDDDIKLDPDLKLKPEKQEEFIERLVAFMTKSIKTNISIYETLEDNQINLIEEFVKNYKEAFAAKNINVTEDVVFSKAKESSGVFPFSFRASYRGISDFEVFGTIETKSPRIEVSARVPGVGQLTVIRKSYLAMIENMMDKTLEWVADRTQVTLNQAIAEYIQRRRQ